MPNEFVGDWVPRRVSCESPAKLRVGAKTVTLINDSDSQNFGNLDLCYSCEGGARYDGAVVWLVPEFGKSPGLFTVYFNAKEEKGTTVVEFESPQLKKRFPLHEVKLRKCANKT